MIDLNVNGYKYEIYLDGKLHSMLDFSRGNVCYEERQVMHFNAPFMFLGELRKREEDGMRNVKLWYETITNPLVLNAFGVKSIV